MLFELTDPSVEDYSNSIELYDTMPKYYMGGAEREKGKTVESLPIFNRDFQHRGKEYQLEVAPASIQDKKSGKTISYYPSQREELVEEAIRKIATRGRLRQFDGEEEGRGIKMGVGFTYYELQKELRGMKHGYAIDEIKMAIEILGKANLTYFSKDGNEIGITSNYFSFVGRETKEMGGKEKVLVMFHPLVANSINHGTFRLFNYDKLMRMKMQLARYIHKRISHMFSQATVNNPYEIKLSTIVRDSGMKNYKTIGERKRRVGKALKELIEHKVINSVSEEPIKNNNKTVDILYSLYMSEEFVADAKKANKLANVRLENNSGEAKGGFNREELRQEIEKPIYGLTKTVINNYVSKVHTREDYDIIVNALAAAKEYIEHKRKKGEEVIPAATTKAAIKNLWMPKNDPSEISAPVVEKPIVTPEQEIENIEKKEQEHRTLQENPIWFQIRKEIENQVDQQAWENGLLLWSFIQ